METLLRAIRLLAMVLWVGGLLFFAFVLAPVSFHVLPSTHQAGLIVGAALVILHRIGSVCGALFLIATFLLWRGRHVPRSRIYPIQMVLIAFMLIITAYLQASVLPAMERDRAQVGGDLSAAPPSNPARLDFDRLHPLSERLEGAVLFAGLGIVFLMAGETRVSREVA